METEKLEFHPIAESFPLLDEKRLEELTESIRQRGLLNPIVLFEDKILDGRNRFLACQRAGVKPRFTEKKDFNPWLLVWDQNANRRDITDEQRYLIWKTRIAPGAKEWEEGQQRIAEEANRKRSEATKAQPRTEDRTRVTSGAVTTSVRTSQHPEQRLAAELSQTNRGAVARGDQLVKHPDLVDAVISGKMSTSRAHAERKKREHNAKVKKVRSRAVKPPEGPFELILADPPWQYDGITTTPERTIETHYNTEHLKVIFSHRPDAAENSILLLWATAPLLVEALEVMGAWNFTYKSCAIWDKGKIGLGYWFRVQHELLLIGTRGKVSPTPEPARIGSIFRSSPTGHSVKPLAVYEWIEFAFVDKRKLEMYAREARPGWASWGNEIAP